MEVVLQAVFDSDKNQEDEASKFYSFLSALYCKGKWKRADNGYRVTL